MQHTRSHPHEPVAGADDLASIILARPHPRHRRTAALGFDASSVAVLALAILGIAVVLGVAVSAVRDSSGELPRQVTAEPLAGSAIDASIGAPGEPGSAVRRDGAGAANSDIGAAAAPVAVAGTDLKVGRISVARSTNAFGATVRARIANVGDEPVGSTSGSVATLIVDGQPVATRALNLGAAGSANATANVAFSVPTCDGATHSVVVIADAAARIAESDEADNVRSTQLDWPC